jgi:predicted AAA+ superfamily ATPase
MDLSRYLQSAIQADLADKMVFLAGPRQVGKTTLARRVLRERGAGSYLSWDSREDRRDIRAARWPAGEAVVVLDELHKWRGWKGWLKGEFDKHRDRLRFLVTGSARLDVHRRGGDSLQGRYHHHRLHPFSCAEASSGGVPRGILPGQEIEVPGTADPGLVEALLEYGGFPEPFLGQSPRGLRRWQKAWLERFFREDVRDLEPIRDLSTFQLLAELLPEKVGSLLSLNALREDLEVSHRALTHWMDVLETMYYVFRVRPHAGLRARQLTKMPKAYMWDSSLVLDRSARFENLVASHLLKLCHYLEDAEGHAVELRFVRDREGRECDFLVLAGRRPWFLVEAKLAQTQVDPAVIHFKERFKVPWAYQVTLEGGRDFVQDGVRVVPASRFLAALV